MANFSFGYLSFLLFVSKFQKLSFFILTSLNNFCTVHKRVSGSSFVSQDGSIQFLAFRCNFRHHTEDWTTNRGLHFVVSMAVNMMPCPTIWPGEEQPSLLDQEGSLSNQDPVSEPCLPIRGEQLVHDSSESPANTRPPRSKSKGELVIVINEKLKNSKLLSLTWF